MITSLYLILVAHISSLSIFVRSSQRQWNQCFLNSSRRYNKGNWQQAESWQVQAELQEQLFYQKGNAALDQVRRKMATSPLRKGFQTWLDKITVTWLSHRLDQRPLEISSHHHVSEIPCSTQAFPASPASLSWTLATSIVCRLSHHKWYILSLVF